MQIGALRPYEAALSTRTPLVLHHPDGTAIQLDIGRWLDTADAADHTAVRHAIGPMLDVGCGPGRITAAVAGRGLPALGIDISEVAVTIARRQGVTALRRDVFADLPHEGRWGSVYLIDGNIGIGGDPLRLLQRAAELLRPDGRVVVETHVDRCADFRLRARFAGRDGRAAGPDFPWAHVGIDALGRYASAAGLAVEQTWTAGGRPFAVARSANERDDAGLIALPARPAPPPRRVRVA